MNTTNKNSLLGAVRSKGIGDTLFRHGEKRDLAW